MCDMCCDDRFEMIGCVEVFALWKDDCQIRRRR